MIVFEKQPTGVFSSSHVSSGEIKQMDGFRLLHPATVRGQIHNPPGGVGILLFESRCFFFWQDQAQSSCLEFYSSSTYIPLAVDKGGLEAFCFLIIYAI
jgi:hypothetical protein